MGFRPVRLSDSTSYVSLRDPALDWETIVDEAIEADTALKDSTAVSELVKRKQVIDGIIGKTVAESFRSPSVTLKLKTKAGETATRFVIGVIPPDQMARINDESKPRKVDGKWDRGDEELYWRSFLASIRAIEGWPGSSKIPTKDIGGVEYLDPSWLKANFVRGLREIAVEVGRVAWHWQQVDDEEAKN